jgi:hypothetical protein
MLHRDDIKIKVFCFYEAVMMNGTVGKSWKASLQYWLDTTIAASMQIIGT